MGFDRARDEWRTAKKNAYPPALCQVLADGITDAVNHVRASCDDDVWPEDMMGGGGGGASWIVEGFLRKMRPIPRDRRGLGARCCCITLWSEPCRPRAGHFFTARAQAWFVRTRAWDRNGV
eukprot:1207931-Pyramimonas_sp.AAC.1